MTNYHQPLLPGETYHLFNRAVGDEKLFLQNDNYLFFLQKLELHTLPVAHLFTYALIPNHFHLLVKIKTYEQVAEAFEKAKNKPVDKLTNLPDFVMERFSNWLNSYTKAFNKVYHRRGSLFIDFIKRNHADSNDAFAAFVFYIHKNAVHHGLTKAIGDWRFDGYQSHLSNTPTNLLTEELLQFFGGRQGFIDFHNRPVGLKGVDFKEE